MEKTDLRKTMKPYWQPPADRFVLVEVPPLNFVMVDGQGDPNTSPAYHEAIRWLYGVSYAAKFAAKAAGKDYSVAPLEALWWAEDMSSFVDGRRENWLWTAMIMQPEWVSAEMVASATEKTRQKLGAPPASLRFERFDEGLCVQIMHVGPYSAEAPTIARMHGEFLPANGLRENGHHHEIYLGDPRKVAPEKLRTVLRQPVARA